MFSLPIHNDMKAISIVHLITSLMKGYCDNLWPTLPFSIILNFKFLHFFSITAFSFCRFTSIKNCTRTDGFLNTFKPPPTNQTLFVLKNQNPTNFNHSIPWPNANWFLLQTFSINPLTDCSHSESHRPN